MEWLQYNAYNSSQKLERDRNVPYLLESKRSRVFGRGLLLRVSSNRHGFHINSSYILVGKFVSYTKHFFLNLSYIINYELNRYAIITSTTVGYGDMYPVTIGGKIFGAACACCGIILIAIPISLLANNFSAVYQSMSIKKEIMEYYRERNGIKIEDSKTKMKRMWQKIKCNKKTEDMKENSEKA
jgi:hypothetical protein